MAAPEMTKNAAGNVRASASLGAGANETVTTALDFSEKIEGQVTVKNTPGTMSATKGLRCEFLPRYGSTPATTTLPAISMDLPSAAAAAESKTFYLGTGVWALKLTNLDASNPVTVEVTSDTVDGIS